MTMNFITVYGAIVDLLGDEAAGRYRVCGYKNEPEDALLIKDTSACVSVFVGDVEIPENKSSSAGPFHWNCTYNIELAITTKATADLAVLEDPDATQGQRATAIASIQTAKALGEQAINNLIATVYQVLMSATNLDLGLEIGVFSNRWIAKIDKDEPNNMADMVVSKANMHLTLSVEEEVTGLLGEDLEDVDVTINLDDEPDDGQAGIIETYVSEE